MKRILLPFFALVVLACHAQILEPAHWSTSMSVSEAKIGDEIDLVFSVKIDKDWYLYSTEFPCEDGPIPTEFIFKPHKSYALVGKIIPINPKDKYDENFGCDVKVFEKTAEFRQRVKILSAPINIKGEYSFQVCQTTCIPGEGEFSFTNLKIVGVAKTEEPKSIQPKKETIPVDTVSKEETKIAYGKNTGPVLDKSILEGEPTIDEGSFFGYLLFAFYSRANLHYYPLRIPYVTNDGNILSAR